MPGPRITLTQEDGLMAGLHAYLIGIKLNIIGKRTLAVLV